MTSLNAGALAVGSVTFIDSSISDTKIGIKTAYGPNPNPPAGNSLILENVALKNVPIAVQSANNVTALQGTPVNTHIAAWGEGHAYTPTGPRTFQGSITPVSRPGNLLQSDGKYYERTKPSYKDNPLSDFSSARDFGATGNGHVSILVHVSAVTS
jgi:glucan 1,3-beta-glucosidase